MDEKLLKKVISGDKKAFSMLYQILFDALWAYVYSRIKNKDITSDIVSDSFISFYENAKNIKYTRAVKSYLYRIAKNKMIKYYKREKTLLLSEFDLDRVIVEDRSEKKPPAKLILRLEKVLSKLPANYEDVLRLRFLSELKIKEVAELLGKSENNVKVTQNRAIKKAKKLVFNLYNIKC